MEQMNIRQAARWAERKDILDGELIRVEGDCHIVWDAYSQSELPTYPLLQRYAPQRKVDAMVRATGCAAEQAQAYLIAEEGDEGDAIESYQVDRVPS